MSPLCHSFVIPLSFLCYPFVIPLSSLCHPFVIPAWRKLWGCFTYQDLTRPACADFKISEWNLNQRCNVKCPIYLICKFFELLDKISGSLFKHKSPSSGTNLEGYLARGGLRVCTRCFFVCFSRKYWTYWVWLTVNCRWFISLSTDLCLDFNNVSTLARFNYTGDKEDRWVKGSCEDGGQGQAISLVLVFLYPKILLWRKRFKS